jgi:hypothetical protein
LLIPRRSKNEFESTATASAARAAVSYPGFQGRQHQSRAYVSKASGSASAATELQRLPQQMPVKVLLSHEADALPADTVRQSGGYVLITGDA